MAEVLSRASGAVREIAAPAGELPHYAGFKIPAPDRTAIAAARPCGPSKMSVRARHPAPIPDSPLTFSMEGLCGARFLPSLACLTSGRPDGIPCSPSTKFQEEIGGALSGRRPRCAAHRAARRGWNPVRAEYPGACTRGRLRRVEQEQFLVAADATTFIGSDEMSMLSPAVVPSAPPLPYVALSRGRCAKELGLSAKDEIVRNSGLTDKTAAAAGGRYTRGPVQAGTVAGLPVGLPEMEPV